MRYAIGLIVLVVLVILAVVLLNEIQNQPPSPGDDSGEVDITIDLDDTEAVADGIVEITVRAAEETTGNLESFLERLINTPRSDLMRLLMVVGGVILLVAGWRVYDFIVVIAGFIIGAATAVSLLTTDSTLMTVGAILLGGLIGAALSVYVYFLAVFLIGAYMGIVLTGALAGELALTPISPLILLIGGLLGGFVLLGLSFEFLIFVSSIVGAQLLTLALDLDGTWTIILAIVGIILQLGFIRYYHYGYRRRPVNPLRRVFA